MDIATAFSLTNEDLCSYTDILVELELPWKDAGAYQLSVGGEIRNAEHYSVSPCGHIAFFDDESQQLTVLSLAYNLTGEQYSYKGKLLWLHRCGRHYCEVRAFANVHTLRLTHHKPASRRRSAIDKNMEMKDTPQNRALLRAKFEQRSRAIQ